jgi:hypothetical protein
MKKTLLTFAALALFAAPALAGGMGGCNSANKAHLASAIPEVPVEPVANASPIPADTFAEMVLAEAPSLVLDTSIRTSQ